MRFRVTLQQDALEEKRTSRSFGCLWKRNGLLVHSAACGGSGALSLFWPIASNCFCNVSAPRDFIGRLTKILMRFVIMRIASANAKRISASVPILAAGSGKPQWAVIGCPGQTGHVSAAASSQRVNAKSSFGAFGPVNSVQLFERTLLTS